jgi:hypothetical protein
MTVIDPRTGYVRAMVGGTDADYWDAHSTDGRVNLATGGSTGRQAGSSFKPFALVAALENGISPSTVFAAPSYIERYGLPQSLDRLREHQIVDHTTLHSLPAMKLWSEVVEHAPAVVLRTNSSYVAMEAVRVGYGISVFPDYVTKMSNLIAAPIDLKIVRDIWLVSHEETNKGVRIRTVIDYVRDQFRQDEREWFSLPQTSSAVAAG